MFKSLLGNSDSKGSQTACQFVFGCQELRNASRRGLTINSLAVLRLKFCSMTKFTPPPPKEADIELGPNFGSYCRVCIDFERNGLAAFDGEGNYAGYDGMVIISQILNRFEQLEMYKDCLFLSDFLSCYKEKFNR